MENKPTEEELDAKIKEATDIEEEDLLKSTEEDHEEEVEVEEEKPEEVEKKPEPEAEKEEKPDLKEKLSASARENQKILAKNRVLNKAIVEAEEIPEPTEDEMKSIYKDDWDLMSDIDRDLAKESILTKKWREKIAEASNQAKKIEKWTDSVDEFIDDPKNFVDHPELDGKESEFREFAVKDENNNVPFNLLVSAFLFDQSKKPVNKGEMFLSGKGGPKDDPAPKSDKISLDEARKIKAVDYNRYKELLMADKIDMSL